MPEHRRLQCLLLFALEALRVRVGDGGDHDNIENASENESMKTMKHMWKGESKRVNKCAKDREKISNERMKVLSKPCTFLEIVQRRLRVFSEAFDLVEKEEKQ